MASDSSDSELSSAPPSPSAQIPEEEILAEPRHASPTPPPAKTGDKKSNKKPAPKISTSTSRRSSRVAESGSHSNSPEKLQHDALPDASEDVSSTGIKIKLNLGKSSKKRDEPPTPTIPKDTQEDDLDDRPSKGKKRKSVAAERPTGEIEARGKMGTKRSKVSHPEKTPDQESEKPLPRKKGTVVKVLRTGGTTTASDDLRDLFSDDGNDDVPDAGPSTRATVDDSEILAERPNKRSVVQKSKKEARARKADDEYIDDENLIEESKVTVGPEKTLTSRVKANKDKKAKVTVAVKSPVKEVSTKVTGNASSGRTKSTEQEAPLANVVRKSKSFAQAVSGVDPTSDPDSQVTAQAPPATKKDKKPLPTIPKVSKLANSGLNTNASATASPISTPQSGVKKPPAPGAGPSGASGSIKKGTPAPVVKKPVHAPSLLESTMKTLMTNTASASVPQKKEETKATTSVKPAKTYAKGEWTDEWVLTATEQREVLESKAEREAARAERMKYRKNPVNLQEAKDAYRLDATIPRVIDCKPEGGMVPLGIRTEGAITKMVAALHRQWGRT